MNRTLTLVLILAVGLVTAGCPKKPTTVPGKSGDTVSQQAGGSTAGAGTGSTGQATPLPGGSAGAGQDATLAAENIIHFDYDSSEIRAEYASVIAANGKRLAADRSLKVRLEGHTDERGSAEYNVALGERRAQAVKRALLLQGASDTQLTTVSFGRERPVADGHDEAAWSQNRRVEIRYLSH